MLKRFGWVVLALALVALPQVVDAAGGSGGGGGGGGGGTTLAGFLAHLPNSNTSIATLAKRKRPLYPNWLPG